MKNRFSSQHESYLKSDIQSLLKMPNPELSALGKQHTVIITLFYGMT